MMAAPVPDFQTARLTVTHWQARQSDPDLAEALRTILTDTVLSDLPPPLGLGEGGVPDWIADRAKESDVYLVETDRLIGLLILADTGAALHLGYLLGEAHWGMGYASELIAGLVATADAADISMLAGGVSLTNPASARVLQKAGFTRDPALSGAGTDMYQRAAP